MMRHYYYKLILSLLFLVVVLFFIVPHCNGQIKIQGGHLYNVTGKGKVDLLFDDNTKTSANPNKDQSNWAGISYTGPFVFWIVPDSIYSDLSINRFHNGFGSDEWDVILHDSSRINSDTFSIKGTVGGWEMINLKSSFPVRFIECRTVHANANIHELKFWGKAVKKATSILPSRKSYPPDPGKLFQGAGKLYPYRGHDSIAYSLRLQTDRNWIDAQTVGITPSTHLYELSVTGMREAWLKDNDSTQWQVGYYLAGASAANSYGSYNQVKDIPHGWDSTKQTSWINDYRLGEWFGKSFGGLMGWYEIGNEDVATWVDKQRYHSPEVWLEKQRAGTLGVKSSGSKIKIVSGAITFFDTTFLKGVYLLNYFKYGEDNWLPDVIAVNHYLTSTGGQNITPSKGVSPGQAKIYDELKEFIRFANVYYPGCEVWWTEFGYDIHNSDYEALPVVNETREFTQGKLLLQTYEWASAAKIHRAFMYTQSNHGGGPFATSGIDYASDKEGWWQSYKKEGYYFLTTRAGVIRNLKGWNTIIKNGDSTGINIFKYEHLTNSDTIVYSIFKGTNANLKETSYLFNLPGVSSAKLVSVKVGKTWGDTTTLKIVNGVITIPIVTETPAYIIVKTAPIPPASADTYYKISKVIYTLDDKTLLLARDVKQRRKSNRTTIIDYTLSDGTIIKEAQIIYKTTATRL